MENIVMSRFKVRYLDAKRGDTVREWEGEALNETDALEKAYEYDYYFGKVIDVEELD